MSHPELLRLQRLLATESGADLAGVPCAARLSGQTVMVTGAGGSIGAALAAAIAAAAPAQLVLLDSSEYNLFRIQQRLESAYPRVTHAAVLGSVADARLLGRIFGGHHPAIVFHTAALKHVSLLEQNPLAAVANNALGTYTLAQAALRHGVPALLMVSTDKAVNPRSIMGASKRLAELALASLSAPHCRMNAVRLGNVIGSSGSAIPIFQEQIAGGEAVTVTHPEVTRFFVTPAEAVATILAAGAAECSGRVLLPELGAPVHILDIARFLIAQHAADGRGESPIRFTGLRPGEKLAEELMFASERREGTLDGGLGVLRTNAPAPPELREWMGQLERGIADGDLDGVIEVICMMVPEYEPSTLVRAAIACGREAALAPEETIPALQEVAHGVETGVAQGVEKGVAQ